MLRCFRAALDRAGGGEILACDIDRLASALQVADKKCIVPRCRDKEFIPYILALCSEEDVDAVIPLIDTELDMFAKSKKLFAGIGTDVLISDYGVIGTCSSKFATASFFNSIGLRSLQTALLMQDRASIGISFPAVIKPDKGSGGEGVHFVDSQDDVDVLMRDIEEPVLQELAKGQEITIDCLVDKQGALVRFVARERLEIRAGESSKGKTFKDNKLKDLLIRLSSELKAYGPIAIQCFRDDDGYIFSEINPRFGGGYPLAHAAGADFPQLLISIMKGENIGGKIDDYEEDVYMTRYDHAFFLRENKATKEFVQLG